MQSENLDSIIKKFSEAERDELIALLTGEDEILSQVALLNLSSVHSKEEAERIVFNLTEHSSETREYAAFLINRLMKTDNQREYFRGDKIFENFSNAIADVNPKVCRKIIEILPLYKDLDRLYDVIIKKSFDYIENLQEKNKNKNYQYNTLSFRLYWCINALGYCINRNFILKYETDLTKLLKQLFEFKEYTLREKAAYLAERINKISEVQEVKNIIQSNRNDENFFVKEVFSPN